MINKVNRLSSVLTLKIVGLGMALLLGVSSVAQAQEIRERDTVWVKGQDRPFVGLIMGDVDADPLIIQLDNGVKATVKKSDIKQMKLRQNAVEAYSAHAKTLKPADAQGHYKLAQWCVDQELLNGAASELDFALKANEKLAEAYELAVFLSSEQLEKSAPGEQQELLYDRLLGVVSQALKNDCWTARIGLAQGQALVTLGLFEASGPIFKKVITELAKNASPNKVQVYLLKKAWIGLGQAQLATGSYKDAQDSMDKLIALEAESFQGHFHRGQAKLGLGKYEEASADFSKALTIESAHAEAHVEQAMCFAQLGRIDEAINNLKQGLALGLNDSESVRTQLGFLYLRKGQLKSAGHEFIKTREDRLYGPAEVGLALIKARKDDLPGALAALKKAESLIPLDGMPKALRAQLLAKLGRDAEAVRAYQDALRLGFNVKIGLRALASLAVKRGKGKRSAQWLNYLVNNQTLKNADDCYRLGRLLLKKKSLDRARDVFEAALKLNPDHAPSLNGLGFIAYNEKNYRDAKQYFQAVINLEKTNLYAKRALKNIAESRTRKVWADNFKREGPGIANRWTQEVGFGIVVKLEKQTVVFSGLQANKDMGRTSLVRKIDDGEFVRFEATINTRGINNARAGIRIRARGAEVIMFRSEDGTKLMGATKLSPTANATVVELGPWPGDVEEHNLALEVEDDRTGLVSFHIDGDRVGETIAQAFRRVKPVDLVIYGQSKVDEKWKFELSKVRVFVKKNGVKKSTGKGGDY
jgi:tetratricopeptide (TPR) repeat protein